MSHKNEPAKARATPDPYAKEVKHSSEPEGSPDPDPTSPTTGPHSKDHPEPNDNPEAADAAQGSPISPAKTEPEGVAQDLPASQSLPPYQPVGRNPAGRPEPSTLAPVHTFVKPFSEWFVVFCEVTHYGLLCFVKSPMS